MNIRRYAFLWLLYWLIMLIKLSGKTLRKTPIANVGLFEHADIQ